MMADYNEAIKNSQTVHGMPMTIRLAIEALEKQIPKKPIKDGYFRLCPHCETEEIEFEIEDSLEYEKFDFCPRCGQALDWEGFE